MHHRALVRYAAQQVDGDGDEGDDREDAARVDGLGGGDGAAAGGGGARFEEVGAFVRGGGNEGDVGWGEGVAVADEGDDGGFLADGGGVFVFAWAVRWLFGLLVVVIIVVVVVVVVVVVIFAGVAGFVLAATSLAFIELSGVVPGEGVVAGGAVGVVQEEFAAAEERGG